MKITPYQTIYGDHVTYRCKVTLNDGRTLDLKGGAGTDWEALAATVSAKPEPAIDPTDAMRLELEEARVAIDALEAVIENA